MNKYAILLTLTVALTLIAAGCSGSQQEQKPSGQQAPKSQGKEGAPAPANPEVALGQAAELQDRTLIVNSAQPGFTPQGPGQRKPSGGNQFVLVNLTVANKSSSAININANEFKLQDSSGTQKGYVAMPQAIQNPISSGSIAAGGSTTGNLVFEAPQGESNLKLVYTPIKTPKETATVDL